MDGVNRIAWALEKPRIKLQEYLEERRRIQDLDRELEQALIDPGLIERILSGQRAAALGGGPVKIPFISAKNNHVIAASFRRYGKSIDGILRPAV